MSSKKKYSKLTTAQKSKIYKKRVRTIIRIGKISLYSAALALGVKAASSAYEASYVAGSSVGKFGYVNEASASYIKEQYAWLYPLIDKAIREFDVEQTDERVENYIRKELERNEKLKMSHMVNGARGEELSKYDVDEEELRYNAVNEVHSVERD